MNPITGSQHASPVGPLLSEHRIFQRYGAALALVLLIGVLRLSLSPLMGRDAPLMPFVLAVFGAAYLGGAGPAMFAAVLTPLLITPLFTRWPNGGHALAWSSHVVFFLVVSGLVALMMRRLQEAARALKEDMAARTLAEQALVQADQSKDEFLAMLAHELRNPLAPIRTIAHILKSDQLDLATIRRSSDLLQRQASHLARLVDDLLDVARITRGMIELRLERISLLSAIDTAIELVQPALTRKHQTVALTLASTGMYIEADATRLSQAFGNLLSNAAKFSAEHAVIEVRCEDAGNEAVVSIRDPGVGIAPAQLPRVFDLFFQAGPSLDRSQGGIGVGLTIVKRLVEMHGGRIEARSEGLGHGSEFIVRLPRLEGTELSPSASASALVAPVMRSKVLIVDDNADAADSLALYLQMAGHEARATYDGPGALTTLETFAADFVLLDIGLPGMDGYAVARTLRERWPSMLIHALTGYGRSEDRARALDSGFNGHLTKPVDPEQLLQILESRLPA